MQEFNKSASSPNALRPPTYRALSNLYVTQFFMGLQNYFPYLIVDTNSGISWV